MSLQELYSAAMQLPPEERYQLAALILDDDSSGDDDFVFDVEAPEVVAEMQRRLADRQGSMSWDMLRAE
jgi:hypothetical protein